MGRAQGADVGSSSHFSCGLRVCQAVPVPATEGNLSLGPSPRTVRGTNIIPLLVSLSRSMSLGKKRPQACFSLKSERRREQNGVQPREQAWPERGPVLCIYMAVNFSIYSFKAEMYQ